MPALPQPLASSALLPPRLTAHTLESLHAEYCSNWFGICRLMLVAIISALASSPVMDVDVRGTGAVRPRMALQIEHPNLINAFYHLTTEPAMVTVEPSGDTAKKDGLAGPLSDPSLLYGGSVVKILSSRQPLCPLRNDGHTIIIASQALAAPAIAGVMGA